MKQNYMQKKILFCLIEFVIFGLFIRLFYEVLLITAELLWKVRSIRRVHIALKKFYLLFNLFAYSCNNKDMEIEPRRKPYWI